MVSACGRAGKVDARVEDQRLGLIGKVIVHLAFAMNIDCSVSVHSAAELGAWVIITCVRVVDNGHYEGTS